MTVILTVVKPLKPDITPPLFKLVLPPVIFNVPVPLSVPFKVMRPMVGLFPSGKLQLLPTVRVVVLLRVTRLNNVLLQLSAAVAVPLKFTVPPLALKVAPELIVKFDAKFTVPEGALKVEPVLTVKSPLKVALFGTDTVPPVCA